MLNDLNGLSPIGCLTPISSWKLTALVLWVICLVLLVSVGFLAIKLTVSSSQETFQKGANSELSTNASVQRCHPCEDNWHQYGTSCYLFTRTLGSWRDCQHHCSTLHSSFLKLNTEKEMDFVKKLSKMQCYMTQEKFWIGLYYNSSQWKWLWLDGSAFTLDKFQLIRPVSFYDSCKYIKNGQLFDADCKESGYCVCKKTTDEDQIF